MQSNLRSVLTRLDTFAAEAQRRARRGLGRAEQVRLVAHRGWVTPDKAVVLGRAVLADTGLEALLARSPRLLRVAYERFGTLEPEPQAVSVSWRGQSLGTQSDSGGFIDVSFPLGGPPPVDRTRAELVLAGGAGQPAVAEIFGLHPKAQLGIISDIDDTVLETELNSPYKRSLQLIYSEQRMRLPFDGIAALYQAFSHRNNPIFYVSNAPWNLYGHVAELLDHNQIPKGPLLLRDSRIGERLAFDERSGRVLVHKQRALRRLVEDHPRLSFVLLGDSSRRDPLRYVEVAEAHPGRIAAIYIRQVHGIMARRGSLADLQKRAHDIGVELLLADDTLSIARHARSRGFVPAEEVLRVREGKREDEKAPPPTLESMASSEPR